MRTIHTTWETSSHPAKLGGYLLTACFASGRHAGQGVLDWLAGK